MCGCDQAIGEKFLTHQLNEGCVLETQERVPVTLGFVQEVCRECRGLPAIAHPKASIPGRTSKIRRYYWREIQFKTFQRFADRADKAGFDHDAPFTPETQAIYKHVQQEVLEDIKHLHQTTPKYVYTEISEAKFLELHEVEVVRLDAPFSARKEGERAGIIDAQEVVSAEQYVVRHYLRSGWQAIHVESVPFHVLFGVFMWIVIQDAGDPLARMSIFGSRSDYDDGKQSTTVSTFIPSDFGTEGYARRRADIIAEHLEECLKSDLAWLYDLWFDLSADLREYLWAHREKDVRVARQLIEILPRDVIIGILRYLVEDYWGRFVGWPDLLVYKGSEYFFAEVKASKDKLSEEQKHWIANATTELSLPFKLIKIHRLPQQSTAS